MFRKNDHGAEARSDFPDETGVSGEPLDVALIAAVEEDGAKALGPQPVLGADEVPLLEAREVREAEVVEPLREVSGFVPILRLMLLILLRWFSESAEEAWGPFGGGRGWSRRP